MLSLGYIFKASGGIEIGEVFFYRLQQIFVCGKCKDEMDYMINVPRSLRSAIFVEVYGRSLKIVIIVKLF
jgi:hypothetical protein